MQKKQGSEKLREPSSFELLFFLFSLVAMAITMIQVGFFWVKVVAVLFGAAITILWGFYFYEPTKIRKTIRIIFSLIVLAFWLWAFIPPLQELWEKDHPVVSKPLYHAPRPPQKESQRPKKTPAKCEPHFFSYSPEIIKSPEDSPLRVILRIPIENISNCSIFDATGIQINIDRQFQSAPNITKYSMASEIPPKKVQYFHVSGSLPPTIPPMYLVFAIKYYDADVHTKSRKLYSQITYWKYGAADNKMPSPIFDNVSLAERDEILAHLKNDLKDFIK
jgi:hypothetical protein